MNYKEIKEILKKANYKETIKAILSFELKIENNKTLENIYNEYIENDDMYLLSEELYEVKDLINQKEG